MYFRVLNHVLSIPHVGAGAAFYDQTHCFPAKRMNHHTKWNE